jgi:4-hydroxy-tetrahydrodipicolinate synthase
MSEPLAEKLRSVAVTVPTPFDETGAEVRHDALGEYVETMQDAGVRLIIPCGNTGEYYSLSHDERVAVVESTVAASDDGTAVVAGAGGSTKTVRRLLESYERVGVDGAMIMFPSHTYMHLRGVETYYRRIAASTDLDLVLYKRGDELSDDTILSLASLPNVVGVKYAVDDITGFSKAVDRSPDDVVWMDGIAERFAPTFALEGAEGYTSGIGSFVPDVALALMDALRAEEWGRARELRDLVRPYEELRQEPGADNWISSANNVPAIKFGMELAGLYGGPVREPLVELSEADKSRAREYYDRIVEHGP